MTEEEYRRMPDVMTDKKMKFFDPSTFDTSFCHRNLGLPEWILPDGRILMSRKPHSYIWFAFSDERKRAMLEAYGKEAIFPHCSLTLTNPFSDEELDGRVSKMDGGSIVRELTIQLGLIRMGLVVEGSFIVAYGLSMTRAQFGSICDMFEATKRGWTEFDYAAIEQFDGLDSVMARIYTDESEFRVRFLNDVRNSCEIRD